MPTWRNDKSLKYYSLDYQRLLLAITAKFGGEWILMVRLHPMMYNHQVLDLESHIINATFYTDIQELLVASDIAITDYSSTIFDFMLSYKPGFIFATDYKEYYKKRGLEYPITDTPFPFAKNNDEMQKNIEDFNYEKYKIDVKRFLEDKGCIDDGYASKRVVELIKNILSNSTQS